MLIKVLLPVLFAVRALADLASISSSLSVVNGDVKALDGTLVQFSGGLLSALPILSASAELELALEKGARTARASSPLSLDDGLVLANYVADLATETKSTIDHLIQRKHALDKLIVVTPIALSSVKKLRLGTDEFANAILEKLPGDLQSVGKGLVKGIDDDFERGIKALSTWEL